MLRHGWGRAAIVDHLISLIMLKILLALLLGMATPVATNSDGDDEPKNDGEETTLPDPGPPGDIGHVPPKK